MPKIILAASLLAVCAGCAVRSPAMYARDTGAVLATRNDTIQSCYDGVLKKTPDAKGTVTIKFDVDTQGGSVTNIAVDPSGTTAPQPVADCVTQNLSGLAVTPPDTRRGKGTWVYEFAAGGTTTHLAPSSSQPAPAQVTVTVGPKS